MLPLILLGAALSYAVLRSGGVEARDWYITAWLAAVAALADQFFHRKARSAPPAARVFGWLLALLPAYAAFQLLPLPVRVLHLLSPQRAAQVEQAAAFLPGSWSFAPLSVAPAATLEHLLRIFVFLLVFLTVREIAWRFAEPPWKLALPLIAIAGLEAALGLAQFYAGGPEARGTYVNRNHFAGCLEMALPFAAVYPLVVMHRERRRSQLRAAVLACAGFGAAAAILLGIVYSLSRMGFVCGVFAAFLTAAGLLVWGPSSHPWAKARLIRVVGLSGCLCAVLLVFLFLPPDRLIARFAGLSSGAIAGQDRFELWGETLRLVAAYPVFGCGLGTYESAFMQYKVSYPAVRDEFAHNDYLQSLAELGVIGFAISGALAMAVLTRAFKAARSHSCLEGRALGVASIAALGAILLHSTVDFNLYIPANALIVAWISGIAESTMFSSRPAPTPRVVEAIACN